MNPEHLHLLINHVPIHGLAFSMLVLLVGLLIKSRPTQLTGVALVLVASLSIPFVMGSGEGAYESYRKDDPETARLDAASLEVAREHYEAAEKGAKATYLLAVLAALVLVAARWRPKWFVSGSWSLVILAVLCLVLNAWIAKSGGEIRRPDFRSVELNESNE
jgi:peptidoglycan/LPS O-acetylase OafA/YrhL